MADWGGGYTIFRPDQTNAMTSVAASVVTSLATGVVRGRRSRRVYVGESAASTPNRFGPNASQRYKQSTHCGWHVFVWSNHREKVSQPWWGLANLRPLGRDLGQRLNEHCERFTTGQRRCRSKYGVKPRIASGAGDGLGGGTVVGHKICLIHAEMRSCRLVCEVEDVKVDRYPTNAATHLEWIDSFINEVTKELRPCALLPVGRVPDPRLPRFGGSGQAPGRGLHRM